MRTLILTNNQGNQFALINKIAKECDVAGIVFSRNIPRKPPPISKRLKRLVNRVAGRIVGKEFVDAWFKMQDKYSALYPDLPTENIINVDNVNAPETVEAIESSTPDLIVVSGTNLVGGKVIAAAQKRGGIVNLHTGISPYVKGGPNCTNWCLAKNWFHLIGNTVMWLDAGIDTGNIIATEQTPLTGDETLFELHWKVMEHAHSLYVDAIGRIARGEEVRSVPQKSVAEGHDFYSTDWGLTAMREASANFHNNYQAYFADPAKHRELSAELKLFPFNN